MGAFKTTTFDADPNNVIEIDANVFMEYDATIVILFSSTCGPCKNMMKQVLQPYYEKYGDKVLVIGVLQAGSNTSSEALSIAGWKKENGITFPTIVVGTQDANGKFDTGIVYAGPFGGSGLGSLGTGVPQTYICDRTGKVSGTIYGFDSGAETRIKAMISTIRYNYNK